MAPAWRFLNFLLEPKKNELQIAKISTFAEISKWSIRGVYSSTQFYLIPPPLSVHLIPPPGLKSFYFLPRRRFFRVVFEFYACIYTKILGFFHCICFIHYELNYTVLYPCFSRQDYCSVVKNCIFIAV